MGSVSNKISQTPSVPRISSGKIGLPCSCTGAFHPDPLMQNRQLVMEFPLLPLSQEFRCLRSHKSLARHGTLFWRFNFPSGSPVKYGWAIRKGDWILIKNGWTKTPVALYNFAADPSEQKDLAKQYPERVDAHRLLWDQRNEGNQ